MNIESGNRYLTRSGEVVTVLTIDPIDTFPTEAKLTASAKEWPVVVRIDNGRWRGLTTRVREDGRAQVVDGKIVDHESDLVQAVA